MDKLSIKVGFDFDCELSGLMLWSHAEVERIYPVVYIYPVEPNLCEKITVTDSILGEYMVDAKTSNKASF